MFAARTVPRLKVGWQNQAVDISCRDATAGPMALLCCNTGRGLKLGENLFELASQRRKIDGFFEVGQRPLPITALVLSPWAGR